MDMPSAINNINDIPDAMRARAEEMVGFNPVRDYNNMIDGSRYPYILDIATEFGDWLSWPTRNQPPADKFEAALDQMNPPLEWGYIGQHFLVEETIEVYRQVQAPNSPSAEEFQLAVNQLEAAEFLPVGFIPDGQAAPENVEELRERLGTVIAAHLEDMHVDGHHEPWVDDEEYQPPAQEPVDVNQFPTRQITEADFDSEGECQCPIGLCPLERGQEVTIVANCGHFFCKNCIEMCLADHTTCPMCRGPVQ